MTPLACINARRGGLSDSYTGAIIRSWPGLCNPDQRPADPLRPERGPCRASYARSPLRHRTPHQRGGVMAVSKRLRFEVLRRDNHTCRYCGRSAPEVRLTVDHVLPTALGGTDVPTNLVTACTDCNSGKSATPPDATIVADVSDDAIRWARAAEKAADAMLGDLAVRMHYRDQFKQRWDVWGSGKGQFRKGVPLPSEWTLSVDSILATGLPIDILIECIDIAMHRSNRKNGPSDDDVFRYMCGIAWNKVTELQGTIHRALDIDDEAEEIQARYDEEMARWGLITENFLACLPMWLQEEAERRTRHDFDCAGEPDPGRPEQLPHILRHVGAILQGCPIGRPEPTEVG